jgi:hypothetical protein
MDQSESKGLTWTVKDTLLDLDPSLDGSETDEMYNTALVVLSALSCGPDVTRLAAFTGLPEAFVSLFGDGMKTKASIGTVLQSTLKIKNRTCRCIEFETEHRQSLH